MTVQTPIQYHLRVTADDVGKYVFLPGDPGRCEAIARRFDEPKQVATNREFNTWSGYLDGTRVSVTSTGIGCPSAVIAVEELVQVGADAFVRVGTSGAMQPDIHLGDMAVVTAAIQDEGTTRHYMPVEFPAVANLDVTNALVAGARSVGATVHVGVSHSKDSFYGELEPGRMPVAARLQERWKAWVAGGAICSEMEAAGIFIVSSVLRVRAGGIMLITGNDDEKQMTPEELAAANGMEGLIDAAVAGMRELIAFDRKWTGGPKARVPLVGTGSVRDEGRAR
jgi:uridine phosphorylase